MPLFKPNEMSTWPVKGRDVVVKTKTGKYAVATWDGGPELEYRHWEVSGAVKGYDRELDSDVVEWYPLP